MINFNRKLTSRLLLTLGSIIISTGAAYATANPDSGSFCDCSSSSELICHIPPGNEENMHTINVGEPAIEAHLEHGDILGSCPGDSSASHAESHANNHHNNEHEDEAVSCICADGSPGNWYQNPASSTVYNMRIIHGI